MNIVLASDIQYDSVVDGEGIRTVIWTQGCPHRCKGCHNPETHDFNKGHIVSIEEVKEKLSRGINQDGITLSGGEPFCQPEACTEIAIYAKQLGLNVWCYTGYTYEKLLEMAVLNDKYMKMLENIDVLIDGPFILEQKTLSLKYRGSKNQRIIDVQKSLKRKKLVLLKQYDYIDSNSFDFKEQGVFV